LEYINLGAALKKFHFAHFLPDIYSKKQCFFQSFVCPILEEVEFAYIGSNKPKIPSRQRKQS
jgi:hypothetical protein